MNVETNAGVSSAGISFLWALPSKRYELVVANKKTGRPTRIDLDDPFVTDEYIEKVRCMGYDVDVFDHGELVKR